MPPCKLQPTNLTPPPRHYNGQVTVLSEHCVRWKLCGKKKKHVIGRPPITVTYYIVAGYLMFPQEINHKK